MAATPYNPYAPQADDKIFGAGDVTDAHVHSSWTDGLPHEFKGWGPQTPDPDEDQAAPAPAGDLVWRGKDDDKHFVWRFDMRRHHHN